MTSTKQQQYQQQQQQQHDHDHDNALILSLFAKPTTSRKCKKSSSGDDGDDDDDDHGGGLMALYRPVHQIIMMEESPLFFATALGHIRDALDMMSLADKQDYLDALRLAPVLIQNESHPIHFLRCEDFNPWTAAKRLVLYWKYRRAIFTEGRWLLPLLDDMSGAGALDQDGIDLLRNNWFVFAIPSSSAAASRNSNGSHKANDDDDSGANDVQYGRYLLMDHGKHKGHSPETQMRVVFFIVSAASDKASQTIGFTPIRLLCNAQDGPLPCTTRQYQAAQTCWKMIKEALPVRMNQFILLRPGGTDKKSMLNLFIHRLGSTVATMLGNENDNLGSVVTVEFAQDAAPRLWREFGVPLGALPVSHGGTWSYDRAFEWKEIKARIAAAQQDISQYVKIPWLAEGRCHYGDGLQDDAKCNAGNDLNKIVAENATPGVATTARIREDISKEVRALYARRAYHKRQLKRSTVEQEVKRARIEHDQLLREQKRLEMLVAQAQNMVAELEANSNEPVLPDFDFLGNEDDMRACWGEG